MNQASKGGSTVNRNPFDPAEQNPSATGMIGAGSGSGTKSEDSKLALPPVKLLAFDMGHVFVRFEWAQVCEGFCRRANCSRETFKGVLEKLGKLGYERGTCDTRLFLGKLNQWLGSNISEDEFSNLWNHTFEEDPEMADLLQQLGKRYPLYLVSNTNEVHYTFLQRRYNVERHFKYLIRSYLVGTSKPDREFWQLLITASGLDPQEILVVDDLRVNIDGAQEAGLRTKLFVGKSDLVASLPSYGVSL